jgi:peptide-methionine (S)-S-oxide reductase
MTKLRTIAATIALGAFALWIAGSLVHAEEGRLVPPPALDEAPKQTREVAVLAGGCFWGVQGVFQHVDGVLSAVSGYAGGSRDSAQYAQVGTGRTGHAESVRVTYDPRKVTYGQLLQIFVSVAHDPTELNRQGPDTGPQYRSTIFPTSEEQERVARAYLGQLNQTHAYDRQVVTTVEPGRTFYPAEDYHQDYLTRHPSQPYIVMFDLPKLEALKKLFPNRYRSDPVLVAQTGM